ncbi:MAG: hypothetical protein ACI392_01805 [Paludibacteraceae bacterium]
MLPNTVIDQIKQRSGLALDSANDYESLSAGTNLGINTLKRLCGYTPDTTKPRRSTLNLLAQYLGFETWDLMMNLEPGDSEWDDTCIHADEIQKGESVTVTWQPNRQLTLLCIGDETFEVSSSINGKLQIGDQLHIELFRLHHPLTVTNIVRQGQLLVNSDGTRTAYIAGKQNGISTLTTHFL